MKPFRKILIAVKDPHARNQAGVEKALRIAHTLNAEVELFHALSNPILLDIQPLNGNSLAELKREALHLARERLDKLVARAAKLGLTASRAVTWDFPPHEAIVRAARRFGADLIVAEVHKGRRLAPWLVHLTDWELLRTSSIPVLLLTSIKSWNRAPVLAAVDPSHTNSEASGLDAEVVAHAGTLAAATRSALHIMHSTFTSIAGLTAGDPVIDGSLIATYLDRKEEEDRDEFGTFARRASISAARRHLVTGNPIEEIPKVARALRAGVVVMGAVSRSGLRRVFIGNTAERVLNALPCDVLVVKPPGFATRVAGKSRGIRVVPPQPLMPMPM